MTFNMIKHVTVEPVDFIRDLQFFLASLEDRINKAGYRPQVSVLEWFKETTDDYGSVLSQTKQGHIVQVKAGKKEIDFYFNLDDEFQYVEGLGQRRSSFKGFPMSDFADILVQIQTAYEQAMSSYTTMLGVINSTISRYEITVDSLENPRKKEDEPSF